MIVFFNTLFKKLTTNALLKKRNDEKCFYFAAVRNATHYPCTWHCSWKSCIARANNRLFSNLLADCYIGFIAEGIKVHLTSEYS